MANEIEQGPDGLYPLCIFDAENSTDTEEVFGKFGDILKLHRTNNLVFIRYGSLEEAETCYDSMRNDQTFRVKPGKKKPNSGSFDTQRNRDSFDNTHRQEDMNRNNTNSSFGGRRSDGSDFKRPGFGGGFSNNNSNATGKDALGQPPPLKPVIPGATTEEGSSQAARIAKEVVIGNIPPKMLQCGIYNLCKKAGADPLHVAMKQIVRPQRIPIHYAYVYVREDKDVANIVNGLHNLKVHGYQLIVKPAEILLEEGKVL